MANLPPRTPEHWYGQPSLLPVAPVAPVTPAVPAVVPPVPVIPAVSAVPVAPVPAVLIAAAPVQPEHAVPIAAVPVTAVASVAPVPVAAVASVSPVLNDEFDEEFEATVVVARGRAMTDWHLVDIDGTSFRLATSNVLGRRPTSGPAGAQFISLSDSERVLSRMHALIEVEANELWITDLKSTNGTEILGHEEQVTPCEALRRYPLGADLAVSLGGRPVTFRGPASR